MSNRKHKGAENIENLCPVARKRSTSKSSAAGAAAAAATATASVTKTPIYEHTSSPSVLTYEALEEMGIGMLDSEESSSSAMSAIALAVSATSDENSNETTPCTNAPRMTHQPSSRTSLNSTTSTLDNSSVIKPFEIFNDEPVEPKIINRTVERGLQPKHIFPPPGASPTPVNSPNYKRLRNPLSTVTSNNRFAPTQQQSPLSLLPSTSKQAMSRPEWKPPTANTPAPPRPNSFFVYRLPVVRAHMNTGINHFERLSDEILLSIFKWLPKKTLLRIASICRRFNRCVRDETLWTRIDLGQRTLSPGSLEHVLKRGMPVIRLAQATIRDPAFVSGPPYTNLARVQYLDLSLATISTKSLQTLFAHCRQLKKLSLENLELTDMICFELGHNFEMETLNLSLTTGLTEYGVRTLMLAMYKLNSLNISWAGLQSDAITSLVKNAPINLMRLNIAGCRKVLVDSHVTILQKRCPQLLELDLSDCNSLTDYGLTTIMKFSSLEYLSVSRCYLISCTSFLKVKYMESLTYLDIFGMLNDPQMEVLEKQLPKIGINKFIHSSVGRPTVGARRTSIWGLRTRDA